MGGRRQFGNDRICPNPVNALFLLRVVQNIIRESIGAVECLIIVEFLIF